MMRMLVFFLLNITLWADKYVRDGGTSSACTTWTDACDQLTTAEGVVSRGETIWVADGTYNGGTLDVGNSGTTVITIKKATVAAHGIETGWDNAYGDGQATIGSLILGSDYWTIDGAARNESDWDDGTAYGFRITGVEANTAFTTGVCASHIILRYINAGGSEGTSYTGSEPSSAFKVGGFDEFCADWTVERNYLHNIAHAAHLHMNGLDGGTFQYNWISNGWGKEALRGQIAFKNAIVRYNVFKDSCQNSGEPGEGCTAEIAIWDGGANAFDAVEIYGNVIYKTTSEDNNGGSIVVGGNGGSWTGSPTNNTLIYNNTIAGINSGTASILVNGGTGNEVRNTIWYDCINTPSATPNTSNNGEESTDPFMSYDGGDFQLSAGLAGASLSSPYNIDMNGVTRGVDGTFDRGAFEYETGVGGVTTSKLGGGMRFLGGRIQ